MNVSVGHLEVYARKKVAPGEYGSVSEVVRDGLRLLKRRDELWKAEIEAKIEEGKDSLRVHGPVAAEKVWMEVEARISKIEQRQTAKR